MLYGEQSDYREFNAVTDHRLQTGSLDAALATGVVSLIILVAALLNHYTTDLYYLSVQEDEYLEWATVWAFVVAAVLNVVAANGYWRIRRQSPWFLVGIALFCLFVALEEISWGQRLLGYRPPIYFLDQNFQQEFNLHNIVATHYRKLALSVVILGFGVFLPSLSRLPFMYRLFARLGVVPPPIGLLPTFLATFLLYETYPWSHTGEWVELLLGLGFVLAAAVAARHFGAGVIAQKLRNPLVLTAAILALGLATAFAARLERQSHPGTIAAVRLELQALGEDFDSGRVQIRCGTHKRLYTFVQKYGQRYLEIGAFSKLTAQGHAAERAEFFLDPWNTPYWIRDRCAANGKPRIRFVYSFGPNRHRDSGRTEIRGDDMGEYLEQRR
jgi:hypothetical protein